ncbi:MAG: hypothetical protein KME64_40020 [Scytonematopsis contorta HA4267-MV1]|jgi:hypothetical protein|nr:hypothetical protein [Scytonematopsis contorta HA4267-MV1]
MTNTPDINLMAERLESAKAGAIGGLCLFFAFIISCIVNNFVLSQYFEILKYLSIKTVNLHLLLSLGVTTFSGLLFGVTYRYIIRSDKNPQLKAGGIMAFGLVRGLAQIDIGIKEVGLILPFVVLGLESILYFALAAFVIDVAIKQGLIKAFDG